MLRFLLIFTLLLGSFSPAFATGFDHGTWNNLLRNHVKPVNDGKATVVDYHGMQAERAVLQTYLKSLSAVEKEVFDAWHTSDQLAFLINAYNGWTVEFILTRYPDLESIKELGSFLQSPWKKKFIPLFDEMKSLDEIEHDLIRGSDRYNDPRIHFAVNCASVGCPALRGEAYRGDIIEQQLQDAETLFLSDRSRNRVVNGVFEVSSIFKWYGEDFSKGWNGVDSLEQYLLAHSEKLGFTLSNDDGGGKRKLKIRYLKYEWKLNDL